jgi:hypothetical protein
VSGTVLERDEATRIKRQETRRIERRQVDLPRCSVEDQFSDGLSGRGSVQDTPNAVARGHVDTAGAWDGANQRQAILRDGAMACSARKNTRARQNWRNSRAECFQAINRTVIRND